MNRTLILSLTFGLIVALAGFHNLGNAAGQATGRQPVRIAQSDSSSWRESENENSIVTAVINDLADAAIDFGTSVGDVDRQLLEQLAKVAREQAADEVMAVNQLGRDFLVALSAKPDVLPDSSAIADPSLPPELQSLSERIHDILATYSERQLNSAQQSPWEIMHRIVAFGIPTEIRREGPDGERVNAIGWLLWGNRSNSLPLVVLSGGKPMCTVGPGMQGHPGQFLGMLAQSEVSPTSPFKLQGKSFTVADIIEQEKLDCSSNMELTFKLIAFSYYLKSDETWTNRDGQTWSISKLIQEEIRTPVRSGACGGTHRLFGLSSAYLYRAKRGKPIDGEFKRAQTFIRDYQRYTLSSLENPDGSFSTEWFNHPANASDLPRKLQTTGHILEWLVWSLPEDELRDPRIIRSAKFLADTLSDQTKHDWSVGPLGHALHALAIYDKRLHKLSGSKPEQFAKRAPIYTSSVPHDGPVLPKSTDTPPEPHRGLPAIDGDHSAPRRMTDSQLDNGAKPLPPR
jgi:hypothetical protein